jgi:hemolysin activation/secretion protein
LQWLGRNPFRTVSGIFTPGATPGTTDVIVKVEDRLPLRVYAGYENSGNDATGENRYQAGFNWGNAFLADQLLSYQFSTSDDFSSLTGHSLVWNFALPWRHLVTVIGAMSDSQTDFSLNGQSFASGGESRQLSLRYTVPLTGNARLDHEWSAGFDFKQSNNNLEFGGLQVFDQPTEIAQFLVSYNATLRDAMGATRLDATLFWSPGNLSSKNDDLNFNAARPGAEAAYTYALVRIERALRLPKEWLLVATAQAQFADGNLLASEQLSLGGYDAVRGFEDRLARGDRGFLLNFEVRSPTFPVLSNWLRLPKGRLVGRERMQAVAFLDYGTASLMDALPGEEETVLATSAGIGLRYSIGDLLAVRADYAWQLAQDGFVDDETSRFHLGITVAY